MALKNNKTRSFTLLKGITDNPRTTLVNGTIILFLLLIGTAQLRTALLAQLAFTKAEHPTTFIFSQTDPNVLANIARQEHLGNANLNKAQHLYKRALKNFILHVPSWLGLIEVYNDRGDAQQAKATLGFVDRTFKNTGDTAWSKAILADALDHDDLLISNLMWLADKHPNKKREIFALADLNWNDPQILLNKFGKTYYLDILDYYITANELEKSKIVWQEIVNAQLNDETNSLAYINYLLQNNEFDNGVDAWKSSFNKDGALIYNGNFEKPLTGSGFGWRISKGKGIASKLAGYSGGIQVSFDGSENASFQLSQTIPLPPGEYEFSSSVETDELSTDQRPFWMITGHQCQGLTVEDAMVPPTQHPETFVIPFTVPPGCKAIQISLRRNKSFMIDNKIAGKITVSKLELTSLSKTTDRKLDVADSTTEPSSEPTGVQEIQPVVAEQKEFSVQEIDTKSIATSEEKTLEESLQKTAAMPHFQRTEEAAQPTHPEHEIKPVAEKPETGQAEPAVVKLEDAEPVTEAMVEQEQQKDMAQTLQPTVEPVKKYKRQKRANITINKLIIRP